MRSWGSRTGDSGRMSSSFRLLPSMVMDPTGDREGQALATGTCELRSHGYACF